MAAPDERAYGTFDVAMFDPIMYVRYSVELFKFCLWGTVFAAFPRPVMPGVQAFSECWVHPIGAVGNVCAGLDKHG